MGRPPSLRNVRWATAARSDRPFHCNKPQLILADEATGELDSETTHEVLTLFQTIIADEGITMLLATHDSLVDAYVDKVLQLGAGQILI